MSEGRSKKISAGITIKTQNILTHSRKELTHSLVYRLIKHIHQSLIGKLWNNFSKLTTFSIFFLLLAIFLGVKFFIFIFKDNLQVFPYLLFIVRHEACFGPSRVKV